MPLANFSIFREREGEKMKIIYWKSREKSGN
jgi:hypothetical protein